MSSACCLYINVNETQWPKCATLQLATRTTSLAGADLESRREANLK